MRATLQGDRYQYSTLLFKVSYGKLAYKKDPKKRSAFAARIQQTKKYLPAGDEVTYDLHNPRLTDIRVYEEKNHLRMIHRRIQPSMSGVSDEAVLEG